MARVCKRTISQTNVPPTSRAPGLLTFGAAHLDAVVRVLRRPNDQALRATEPPFDADVVVDTNGDSHGVAARETKMLASKPRKDEERETRQAIIEDAGKTEGKDRDLVHCDGGTLGLGRPRI
jgi:hypothetical protein